MSSFELPIKILFQHCDPAGIVFYPRYFEMINLTVEEWFEQELDYSFAVMQRDEGRGVPTAAIQTEFPAPSRLGDRLIFDLRLSKLGRTSITVQIRARAGDEVRLTATAVLVHIGKADGRPIPWPDATRAKMAPFVIAQ